MKQVYTCYVEMEETQRLKETAREAGVAQGNLLALLIRYGLDQLSMDGLKAWGRKLPGRASGTPGGHMTKVERAVIATLEALQTNQAPAFRFPSEEIGHQA